MDTTYVLSSYFMTADMHRFALMWLAGTVGTNLSEWVQIFQKNLFRGGGEPILGGSKLNVTQPVKHLVLLNPIVVRQCLHFTGYQN